jgi:hypothetical protein
VARGETPTEIAKNLNISRPTVYRWMHRREEQGNIDEKRKTGRKKLLNQNQVETMCAEIQRNRDVTADSLKRMIDVQCSDRTITNYLNNEQYHSFKAPLKPAHFPLHLEARLEFCRILSDWNADDWKKVIFTDESSFYNHRTCKRKIWRKRDEDCPPHYTRSGATQKLRINVWGAICFDRILVLEKVSNNFDRDQYLELIQKHEGILFNSIENSTFMQDNAPIHMKHTVRDFFTRTKYPHIKWPARSPDLNPIENMWGHIKLRLDKLIDQNGEATKEEQLWERVQKVASELDSNYFGKICLSMPKRIQIVINKNGHYSKY